MANYHGLLTEIARPDYADKSDKELVAMLNEWHRTFVPCETKALSIMFADTGLHGLVEVAREKGTIDDALWARWKMLLGVMADRDVPIVLFDARPLLIADIFDSLLALGVIDSTYHTWLTDLGIRSWTCGRRCFARDVTEADVAAARERQPLHDKVKARRAWAEVEYERTIAEVQESHQELQEGDKDFTPAWER